MTVPEGGTHRKHGLLILKTTRRNSDKHLLHNNDYSFFKRNAKAYWLQQQCTLSGQYSYSNPMYSILSVPQIVPAKAQAEANSFRASIQACKNWQWSDLFVKAIQIKGNIGLPAHKIIKIGKTVSRSQSAERNTRIENNTVACGHALQIKPLAISLEL